LRYDFFLKTENDRNDVKQSELSLFFYVCVKGFDINPYNTYNIAICTESEGFSRCILRRGVQIGYLWNEGNLSEFPVWIYIWKPSDRGISIVSLSLTIRDDTVAFLKGRFKHRFFIPIKSISNNIVPRITNKNCIS